MRQCLRPNLLALEGDEYRFVGRAPSHSAFETPPDLAHFDNTIPIRCGHCINCRIRRAIEWKIRGIHEQRSTFKPTLAVTFTYSDANLPEGGSLRRFDLQAAFKRLRYHVGPFRFLACGEYGPNTGRAHYHAVLFGVELPDLYRSGKQCVSRTLSEAWGLGHISFHVATEASIGYVSGYVVKKLRSHHRQDPLMVTVDPESGLITSEEPVSREFLQASNRPGLGAPWIEQHQDQVIEQGFIVIKEKPCYVIPDYYLKTLRNHPGFPEFQERRAAKSLESPTLSPEELHSLGIRIEGEMARRTRSGV